MIGCVVFCVVMAVSAMAWGEGGDGPVSDVLTLEQAMDLALANNFSVKNAALDVQKAGASVAALRTRRLPDLSFSVLESRHLTRESYTFETGVFGTFPVIGPVPPTNTNIETTPQFTTTVTSAATLPLSQQYRIGLGIQQGQVDQDLASEQLRSQRQQVVDQVKQTYYGILQTRNALAANEETLTFLRELDLQVGRHVQEQTALKYESLEVKTRLANAEYETIKLRNHQASLQEHLNELLGRDVQTAFRVTPVPDMPPLSVDQGPAQAEALARRPEVRAARLKVQRAEYDFRIKKSEYIPDVSFTVRYTSPFNTDLLPQNIATVGIFANWEFFDWGRKRQELAEKGTAIEQAKNQVREAENQVTTDVNRQIRKLQEARTQVQVAELAQTAEREKLRVLLDQYAQKAALLHNVLQTQTELADATRQYQQSQLELWTTKASLERALGEE
jgi:outer membrane protein TolC